MARSCDVSLKSPSATVGICGQHISHSKQAGSSVRVLESNMACAVSLRKEAQLHNSAAELGSGKRL